MKVINTNLTKNVARKGMTISSLPMAIFFIGLLSGCSSLPIPTKARVANADYGVVQTQRTVAQRLLDKSIESTAKINLRNFDSVLLKDSRIDVDSFDSKVLLTGEVPSEMAKNNVQTLIASMPDVQTVYNELKVSRPHTVSYNLHDGYITTLFMGKILSHPNLKPSQLDVVTEAGVVYVMGRLTKTQEEQLVSLANQTPAIIELALLTTSVPDIPSTQNLPSLTTSTTPPMSLPTINTSSINTPNVNNPMTTNTPNMSVPQKTPIPYTPPANTTTPQNQPQPYSVPQNYPSPSNYPNYTPPVNQR